MRTVATTFVATGLGVLVASIVLDVAIAVVVIGGARDLETVASLRLATELLPLCLAFTALVAFLTGVAVFFAKAQLNCIVTQESVSSEKRLRAAARLEFA